ncbi:mitochondrial fission ELM1 family protein [Nitrincola tapanii]|uniref:Nucleoside-diphosphate sugar epimerase n=1 Tax=Nitrincola tapanii TaxID=1708751 RepID=A0A5A9W2P7_9GAMM|nr:ELM1/GtrOC1 family putative glycosyltransferase [Nitrincola tapanii]KAA0874365.1 hypothetical protein E1H14_08820 [Nitrincola tapanii]
MSQIWIISDGKPGHFNQSLGLYQALARLKPDLVMHSLPPLKIRDGLQRTWPEAYQQALASGIPKLVIAAGHATHLTLIYLKWRLGCKTLVLMKPSLPWALFDLCLIPEHDQPPMSDRILPTLGALNPMRPGPKQPDSTLLLVGGPSRHSAWNEAEFFAQLQTLQRHTPGRLRVTSSRRTPDATSEKLAHWPNIEFYPAQQTPPGWLAKELAQTQTCWVTQDSVSMVYEALTAGCALGVLEVPQKQRNRLSQGLQKLADAGIITLFSHWTGAALPQPEQAFDEAGRCAQHILTRGWL